MSGHFCRRRDALILKADEESVPCLERNASWAPRSRQGTIYPMAAASLRPSVGMEPGEGASNDQLSNGSSQERKTAPIFLAFGCRGSNTLSKFPSLSGAAAGAGSCLCSHPPPSPTACQADKSFHREQQRACRQTAGKQLLIWPPQR